MIEESTASRVPGLAADMANLNVEPSSWAETSPTSVEAKPASMSNNRPVTDSSDDEGGGMRRHPGFVYQYIVGWAISREAVMTALKTTDAEDPRVRESIYVWARDYVEPLNKWDVRHGAYLKDGDRKNLEVKHETVIIADGDQTPEELEARLDEWKDFPKELWQIHKWMKGPHVFRNMF